MENNFDDYLMINIKAYKDSTNDKIINERRSEQVTKIIS